MHDPWHRSLSTGENVAGSVVLDFFSASNSSGYDVHRYLPREINKLKKIEHRVNLYV